MALCNHELHARNDDECKRQMDRQTDKMATAYTVLAYVSWEE